MPADGSVVARQPLPDPEPVESPRPPLELVPTPAAEAAEEEHEQDEKEEAEPAGPSADDPLKLYVRQIGDGRLLTPAFV